MNMKSVCLALIACLPGLATIAHAENGIADSEMGLSQHDVTDVPTPQRFNYQGVMPGTDPVYQRSYPGAPPQIPHNVEFMIPVTAKVNFCLNCHGHAAELSQPLQGKPTPIPDSHYTDLRKAPDEVGKNLVGSRYVCTQCHVPQADVEVLVDNEF